MKFCASFWYGLFILSKQVNKSITKTGIMFLGCCKIVKVYIYFNYSHIYAKVTINRFDRKNWATLVSVNHNSTWTFKDQISVVKGSTWVPTKYRYSLSFWDPTGTVTHFNNGISLVAFIECRNQLTISLHLF